MHTRLLKVIPAFHGHFARTKNENARVVARDLGRIAREWRGISPGPSQTLDMEFFVECLVKAMECLKQNRDDLLEGWRDLYLKTAERITTHDYEIADKALKV